MNAYGVGRESDRQDANGLGVDQFDERGNTGEARGVRIRSSAGRKELMREPIVSKWELTQARASFDTDVQVLQELDGAGIVRENDLCGQRIDDEVADRLLFVVPPCP